MNTLDLVNKKGLTTIFTKSSLRFTEKSKHKTVERKNRGHGELLYTRGIFSTQRWQKIESLVRPSFQRFQSGLDTRQMNMKRKLNPTQ